MTPAARNRSKLGLIRGMLKDAQEHITTAEKFNRPQNLTVARLRRGPHPRRAGGRPAGPRRDRPASKAGRSFAALRRTYRTKFSAEQYEHEMIVRVALTIASVRNCPLAPVRGPEDPELFPAVGMRTEGGEVLVPATRLVLWKRVRSGPDPRVQVHLGLLREEGALRRRSSPSWLLTSDQSPARGTSTTTSSRSTTTAPRYAVILFLIAESFESAALITQDHLRRRSERPVLEWPEDGHDGDADQDGERQQRPAGPDGEDRPLARVGVDEADEAAKDVLTVAAASRPVARLRRLPRVASCSFSAPRASSNASLMTSFVTDAPWPG